MYCKKRSVTKSSKKRCTMFPTLLLFLFIGIIHYMKIDGIRLVSYGKAHGVFVILLAKMLFWFSIVELVYFWFPPALFYVLPVTLLLFSLYVYLDRKILAQGILSKKTRVNPRFKLKMKSSQPTHSSDSISPKEMKKSQ